MNSSGQRNISILIPVTGWLVGIVVYFRYTLLSGFSDVTGGPGDGQLIYSIHEHWYRVFKGLEGWHDLFCFYPLQNVLGYSDTFLGPGVLYCGFRILGLDPFLSGQFVLFSLATIGFWGMYAWLKRFREFPLPIAAFVAFLFLIASPIYLASRNSHIQLLSIWQFPLGLILIELALRSWNARDGRLWLWFLLFCSWFGLLTYSTFYAAYYFGLLGLLAGIGTVIYFGPRKCFKAIKALKPAVLHLLPGIVILAGFAALFLQTYLPVRVEMGGRSFEMVLQHLPLPKDLFNHSETNLVWGEAFAHYPPYESSYRGEKELGFPPATFIAAFTLALLALIRWRRTPFPIWVGSFVLILGTSLIVRVGDFSLWVIPYQLIPASEGLRAVFRFNIALLIPCLLILATGLERLRSVKIRQRMLLILPVTILIMSEQIQISDNARLLRSEKLALIQEVAPPPDDATAFYAVGIPGPSSNKDVPHNTATYLAQEWNLPTINGRSGFFPKGWDLYDIDPSGAEERLQNWSMVSGLRGTIYLFDIVHKQWGQRLEIAPAPMPRLDGVNIISVPGMFGNFWGYGWSDLESWGIWSDGDRAGFNFEPGAYPNGVRFIHLKAVGFVHEANPERDIDILINGQWIQAIRFETSRPTGEWFVDLGTNYGEVNSLEFIIRNPASPESVGSGKDARDLGIGIITIRLSANRLSP